MAVGSNAVCVGQAVGANRYQRFMVDGWMVRFLFLCVSLLFLRRFFPFPLFVPSSELIESVQRYAATPRQQKLTMMADNNTTTVAR